MSGGYELRSDQCPYVKCSFIIFGIRVFILVVVLLFDCLRQLIFIDVFFLRFKRVFIPSQVFSTFFRLLLKN